MRHLKARALKNGDPRPPPLAAPGADQFLEQVLREAVNGGPGAGDQRYQAVIQLDEYTSIVVGLTRRQELCKRYLDISLSIIFLVLALPLMAIIALAVWISSGHPILFRQQRIGRGGVPYSLLKFRSMHVNAEEVLATDHRLCKLYRSNDFKIPAHVDPRITPIGRIIRRTCVDELPQLWNVVRGDMSLVGPRPVVPLELSEYGEFTPLYCATRPGLTGAWQVFGRYRMTFPERALKELSFLCNWTIRSDLKTLMLTLPAVIRSDP